MGVHLSVSVFNQEKSTNYVDRNSIPLNWLAANNDNVKQTCQPLKLNGMQHFEQQYPTVNMVYKTVVAALAS